MEARLLTSIVSCFGGAQEYSVEKSGDQSYLNYITTPMQHTVIFTHVIMINFSREIVKETVLKNAQYGCFIVK